MKQHNVKEQDVLEAIFQQKQENIKCMVCCISFGLTKSKENSILQHMKSDEHLQQLQTQFYQQTRPQQAEQTTEVDKPVEQQLFTLSTAKNIQGRKGYQGLMEYFKTKIEALLNFSNMSKSTSSNYINGIKKFFFYIYEKDQDTFSESDVVTYLSSQTNRNEKRSMLQYLINKYDLKIKGNKNVSKIQKPELKRQQIYEINQEFDQFLEVFLKDLVEQNFKEIVFLIEVLKYLDIKIICLPYLKFSSLLTQESELQYENNSILHKLHLKVPQVLIGECREYLTFTQLEEETYIFRGKSRREINKYFTEIKEQVQEKVDEKLLQYKVFIQDLTLKQIRQNKQRKDKLLRQSLQQHQSGILAQFQQLKTDNQQLFEQTLIRSSRVWNRAIGITNNNIAEGMNSAILKSQTQCLIEKVIPLPNQEKPDLIIIDDDNNEQKQVEEKTKIQLETQQKMFLIQKGATVNLLTECKSLGVQLPIIIGWQYWLLNRAVRK